MPVQPAAVELLAALDSLIQLDAVVPAVSSSRSSAGTTSRLILLSRAGPDALPALARVASAVEGLRFYAAANVLAEVRSPLFTPILLRDLVLSATVYVSPGGRTRGGGPSGRVRVGDGAPGRAPGFPPAATATANPKKQPSWPFMVMRAGMQRDSDPGRLARLHIVALGLPATIPGGSMWGDACEPHETRRGRRN